MTDETTDEVGTSEPDPAKGTIDDPDVEDPYAHLRVQEGQTPEPDAEPKGGKKGDVPDGLKGKD